MANRFWVGGTWNWDAATTTNWSASSWWAGWASVPTSADSVFFDANSGWLVVTLTAAAASVVSVDFTWFTWTFAGSQTLTVSWNVTLAAWMTISYSWTISFSWAWTKILTSNWKTIAFWIAIQAWTVQLWDNITTSRWWWPTLNAIQLAAWSFDANWKTFTFIWNQFRISWALTFFNVTIAPAAPALTNVVTFDNNVTITGTFANTPGALPKRLFIKSSVNWTPRTLTVATVALQQVDIQDITWAWAWNWNLSGITGNSGNCGGNTGITFTTPGTSYFKTAASASVSSTTVWFTTSGWSTAARVPLPQDTAIFDVNSVTLTGKIITLDLPRMGTVDMTWLINSPTLTSAVSVSFFWNYRLSTWVGSYQGTSVFTFEWRWSYTIKSAAKVWSRNIVIDCVSGSYQLEDAFDNTGNNDITHTSWGFDMNSQNVTIWTFTSSNSNVRSITCGTGNTISIKTNWNLSTVTNLTFNAGTSTITMVNNGASCSFNGWGKTYNNFFNNTWGASICTMSGNNTFNDFKVWALRTHKFASWSVNTISSLTSLWSAWNLVTLTSASGTHTLKKLWWWLISADFLSISTSIAIPINTFYAGANSTNWGTNTNWNFTVPRDPNTAFAGFF